MPSGQAVHLGTCGSRLGLSYALRGEVHAGHARSASGAHGCAPFGVRAASAAHGCGFPLASLWRARRASGAWVSCRLGTLGASAPRQRRMGVRHAWQRWGVRAASAAHGCPAGRQQAGHGRRIGRAWAGNVNFPDQRDRDQGRKLFAPLKAKKFFFKSPTSGFYARR